MQTKTKIYFASDFHLGAPNQQESIQRERKICEWLDLISQDAKEIYNHFQDSHSWEITKKNGELSIHVALDPYNNDLFLFQKHSKLFRKWTKHLLTDKEWDKLVKKYSNYYVYLLGISKDSMTFYIRLSKDLILIN